MLVAVDETVGAADVALAWQSDVAQTVAGGGEQNAVVVMVGVLKTLVARHSTVPVWPAPDSFGPCHNTFPRSA